MTGEQSPALNDDRSTIVLFDPKLSPIEQCDYVELINKKTGTAKAARVWTAEIWSQIEDDLRPPAKFSRHHSLVFEDIDD